MHNFGVDKKENSRYLFHFPFDRKTKNDILAQKSIEQARKRKK